MLEIKISIDPRDVCVNHCRELARYLLVLAGDTLVRAEEPDAIEITNLGDKLDKEEVASHPKSWQETVDDTNKAVDAAVKEAREKFPDAKLTITQQGNVEISGDSIGGDLVEAKPKRKRKTKDVAPPPPAPTLTVAKMPHGAVPPPPVAAVMDKGTFMTKITEAITANRMTHEDVIKACHSEGLINLPDACNHPELYEKLLGAMGA